MNIYASKVKLQHHDTAFDEVSGAIQKSIVDAGAGGFNHSAKGTSSMPWRGPVIIEKLG